MSKVYTPERLRKMVAGKKWIMPYTRLTAIVDPKTQKTLYIEEYGPKEGLFIEGWRALHYPLTSALVTKTYREGSATIVAINQGECPIDIKPSFSPFGIGSCLVKKDEVSIGFEGVGGAGVSASFSRGMAEGVKEVEVINEGGGGKIGKSVVTMPRSSMLLIGVDDTDDDITGATYALVDTLAKEVAEITNCRYFIHGNVQLYPYNSFKTRNCFSSVVGFVIKNSSQKKEIIAYFKKELKKHTVSDNTAMAAFEGFDLPEAFIDYCNSLKFRMATDLDELKALAQKSGVDVFPITGERGLFGAIGALGYWDRPDFAAKLPIQCM